MRTYSYMIITLLLAMFVVGLSVEGEAEANHKKHKKAKKVVEKVVYYTCPMHPEERGVENGKCSECGMKLVKKTAKMQTTCPVMGGKINENMYADHDGMRVYFCCAGCKSKFESDPAKYIKKLRDAGVEPSPVPLGDN